MTDKITIHFDMDGTIADLYGVENWLGYLINKDPYPYIKAKALVNLSRLARQINTLQKQGYTIGIISWLAKSSTEEYNEAITEAKKQWLSKHLPSVRWDKMVIIPYGTPKERYCESDEDILFDDELHNRLTWHGKAYDEKDIFNILKELSRA